MAVPGTDFSTSPAGWAFGQGATVSGGTLNMYSTATVSANHTPSLGSAAYAITPSDSETTFSFEVQRPAGTGASLLIFRDVSTGSSGPMAYISTAGQLSFYTFAKGQAIAAAVSLTYDPVAHKYIRFSGSTAYQTSPDGVTWTTRGNAGGSWTIAGASYRFYSGGSQTISIDNVNYFPPLATTVSAETAAGSGSVPVHAVAFLKQVTGEAAVGSGQAFPPYLITSLLAESAAGGGVLHAPEFNEIFNVTVEAAALTATGAFYAPEVIAPFPTYVAPPPATGWGAAPVPSIGIILNTEVYAQPMRGSLSLLPPGEYVRVTAPSSAAGGAFLAPRRVGPAHSLYARSVVQTPANYGGALAYYRMSDGSSTLTDSTGHGYHGSWHGTKTLVPGALMNDSDQAVLFDNATTQARIGLLPTLNVPRDDPRTMLGNVDPFSPSSQFYSGAGVEAWFRVPNGQTSAEYLVSRNAGVGQASLDVWLEGGVVRVRVTEATAGQNNYTLVGTKLVNDNQWHHVVFTQGRDLTDESPTGAGQIRLYLDGVLHAQGQAPPSIPWRHDVTIGGRTSNDFFEGELDEVAFYDYAPTQWEVREHYLQGTGQGGTPFYLEPTPVEAAGDAYDPAIRKSAIRPLNDLHDDFDFLDLQKWRDQIGVVINGGRAELQHIGDRLLTPDYYQAKDSTFIVKVDRLPINQGTLEILLVNENDTIPDWMYGGIHHFDSFRRHRAIGWKIHKNQEGGRTRTYLEAYTFGESGEGYSKTHQKMIPYIPDDPNFPSPHKWLKLVIEPGRNGGADWYTSVDGVTWDEMYSIHGGEVNIVVSSEIIKDKDGNQTVVTSTEAKYSDINDFFLFDRDLMFEELTEWRGHMRVLIRATNNQNPGAVSLVDNVNVEPEGTGTDQRVEAAPARVTTSSVYEFLEYVLTPRRYTSAKDVAVESPPLRGSATFLDPPEPVFVFTGPIQGLGRFPDPVRGGDAIPISVLVGTAWGSSGRMVSPLRAGDAQPVTVEPIFPITGGGVMLAPTEILTHESKPAPAKAPAIKSIQLRTRKVLVGVTQN